MTPFRLHLAISSNWIFVAGQVGIFCIAGSFLGDGFCHGMEILLDTTKRVALAFNAICAVMTFISFIRVSCEIKVSMKMRSLPQSSDERQNRNSRKSYITLSLMLIGYTIFRIPLWLQLGTAASDVHENNVCSNKAM